MNHLCDNTVQADTRYTGNNATVTVDSGHYKAQGGALADDLIVSTTQTFQLGLIDKAKEAAKTITPAFRPVKVKDREYYVAFLHSYQVTDLRTNTATGQYLDIQKAAMTGGEIEDNPIFDGALGVYTGTLLPEDSRITAGVNGGTSTTAVTTVRRAVLAGSQAIMLAYGRENGPERYTWVEELFDYGNILGVAAGAIFGMKKAVFNSKDYATVIMSTYAVAH